MVERSSDSSLDSPREVLTHLRRDLGIRLATIANATGADERTVRDWRVNPVRVEYERRLRSLAALADLVVRRIGVTDLDDVLNSVPGTAVLELLVADRDDEALQLAKETLVNREGRAD